MAKQYGWNKSKTFDVDNAAFKSKKTISISRRPSLHW